MSTETMKLLFAAATRLGVEVFAAKMPDDAKWKLMKAVEEIANKAVDSVTQIAAICSRKGDQ